MGLNERTKAVLSSPQGTFTHQAAVNAAQELARLEPQGFDLMPMDDVPQILDAAQHGDGWGIVAGRTTSKGTWCPTSTR